MKAAIHPLSKSASAASFRGAVMRYAALILILLAGAANAGEKFKCQAGPVWFSGEPIVVNLTVDDVGKSGTIKVAGVTYDATYRVDGFDRRWDFGPKNDGAFDYAFVMRASGNASYYDFSDVYPGETAPPSQDFICK